MNEIAKQHGFVGTISNDLFTSADLFECLVEQQDENNDGSDDGRKSSRKRRKGN
jgi:hypothetical protein